MVLPVFNFFINNVVALAPEVPFRQVQHQYNCNIKNTLKWLLLHKR